jgi:hypothetical protein
VIINPKEIHLTVGELHNIATLIGEILNIFTKNTDHSITWYEQVEKPVKEDAKRIIDHLKRFKPYKIKEINVKHKNT